MRRLLFIAALAAVVMVATGAVKLYYSDVYVPGSIGIYYSNASTTMSYELVYNLPKSMANSAPLEFGKHYRLYKLVTSAGTYWPTATIMADRAIIYVKFNSTDAPLTFDVYWHTTVSVKILSVASDGTITSNVANGTRALQITPWMRVEGVATDTVRLVITEALYIDSLSGGSPIEFWLP